MSSAEKAYIYIYIYIYIYFTFWEFFTSDLTDGFSLDFDWQNVFLGLQDIFSLSSAVIVVLLPGWFQLLLPYRPSTASTAISTKWQVLFFLIITTKTCLLWAQLAGAQLAAEMQSVYCRIHRLHLCRGVKSPQWVSWIWHKTIWWWESSNAGALGNAKYPFIAITSRSTLAWSGTPDRVLSMGPIKLNSERMLNWIAWNKIVYLY